MEPVEVTFMIFQDPQYPDGFMLVRCEHPESEPEGFVTHVLKGDGGWEPVSEEGSEFEEIYTSGNYPKWASVPDVEPEVENGKDDAARLVV